MSAATGDLWGFAPGSIRPGEFVYGTSVAAVSTSTAGSGGLLGLSGANAGVGAVPGAGAGTGKALDPFAAAQLAMPQRPWTSHETLRLPSSHPACASSYTGRPLSRLHGYKVRDLAASHIARLRTRREPTASIDSDSQLCAEADPNLAAPVTPETDIFGGQPITDLGSPLIATDNGQTGKQVAKYLSNVWRENRNREAASERLERHVKHLVDQWAGQVRRQEEEQVRRQESMMHTRSRLPWRGDDIAPEVIRPLVAPGGVQSRPATAGSVGGPSPRRFVPLTTSPEVVSWRGDLTEDLESYYKSEAWSAQGNARHRWPQLATERTSETAQSSGSATTVAGTSPSENEAPAAPPKATTQTIDVHSTTFSSSVVGITSNIAPPTAPLVQSKPTGLSVLQSQSPSLDPNASIASMSPYRPLMLQATLSGHVPRPNYAGLDSRPKVPGRADPEGIDVRWSEVDIASTLRRSTERAAHLPQPKVVPVVGALPASIKGSTLSDVDASQTSSLSSAPVVPTKSLVPTTGKLNFRGLLKSARSGSSEASSTTTTTQREDDPEPEAADIAWGTARIAVLQAKARATQLAAEAAAKAAASGEGGDAAELLAQTTAEEAEAARRALERALAESNSKPAESEKTSSAPQRKSLSTTGSLASTSSTSSTTAQQKPAQATSQASSTLSEESSEHTSAKILGAIAAPPAGVRRSFTVRAPAGSMVKPPPNVSFASTSSQLSAFAQTPVTVLETPPLPAPPKPPVQPQSKSGFGAKSSRPSSSSKGSGQQGLATVDPASLKASYELPPRPLTAPEYATRTTLLAAQNLAKRQELVECDAIKSKLAQHDLHISRAVLERALVAPVVTFSPAERTMYAPPMSNLSSNPSLVVQTKTTKKKKKTTKSKSGTK